MKLRSWQRDPGGAISHSRISSMPLSRLVSEPRNAAKSSPKKKRRSLLIMKLVMQSCFMYFRIWIRYIRFPLSRQEWEQPDIPCRFRKMMKYSTQKARCFRISRHFWEDVSLKRSSLAISQPVHQMISSVRQVLRVQW